MQSNTPRTLAIKEPKAKIVQKELTIHGDTRIDNYFWLRDDERKDPDVLAYLEEENAFYAATMAKTKPLEDQLFNEMIARIKQDDSSVPVKIDNYWYYTSYSEGQDYPVLNRKLDNLKAKAEILLDENELAKNHDYYYINNWETNDAHTILAYAEDTVSRRQYNIKFKDLTTGKNLPDVLNNTSGNMAWSKDGEYLFYVKKHATTLLPYQVWRHKLGTDVNKDALIYEEKDNTFYTSVSRSKSGDFIYMSLGSTLTTEERILPADRPLGSFKVFLPRERGHEYDVSDRNGRFFILSNWQAENFRLLETSIENSADKSKWNEIISHRKDAFIHDFDLFKNYLVINERVNGLRQLRVMPFAEESKDFVIESDENAFATYFSSNVDMDSDTLRYYYNSPSTPGTIYDYDLCDGVKVPVSVVCRKDMGELKDRPMLIYAYGSYGSSTDPDFSSSRLSLLDRGFVFAIAHVRGGQEMGRQWYKNGKMFNKMNTFTDFIDVTQDLVNKEYSDPKRVYALGGSAGGLLMGVVVNLAPELYDGVNAAVPFVDVISTMLDESIPLTTGEFDEWGNPKIKEQYEYIKSYSPYDQVKAQAYPNLFITTGLHDSQVQYWEPAKWIAKLRELRTNDNLLIMHTDMEAGHGGASGRFKSQRDTARTYAFFINLAERKQ